ncbi:28S ribosomal protein S24, mitochondrial [Onychostruthus taczanowskii]|uniref:28S ribosomal protein S24, mitochondrial n=1 Tax=Onychostruthus taczanowskii TaxID=356909 RepID=UPI001B804DC0|nr:28S ribosomal protein S24, mitochondrial [Onychostruthus taczanowskii]
MAAAARALMVLPRALRVPSATRQFHSSPVCLKARAARVRAGKGDKMVTYEQAHAPQHIGHRKGWLSLHTGNLRGEAGAAPRALEDAFLRRFLAGTFPGLLADEAVLKRRGNLLVICALLARALPPHKLYFLLGYAETLLGHFYKCPVRLELQTVPARTLSRCHTVPVSLSPR